MFRRFHQFAGLQRDEGKTTDKDQSHKREKCCREIADLELTKHESNQSWHQKHRWPSNLYRFVRCQSPQNNSSHGQTDGKHHNGFDHAALMEMLGFLSRTAVVEGFTVTWPEEAD